MLADPAADRYFSQIQVAVRPAQLSERRQQIVLSIVSDRINSALEERDPEDFAPAMNYAVALLAEQVRDVNQTDAPPIEALGEQSLLADLRFRERLRERLDRLCPFWPFCKDSGNDSSPP